MEYLTVYDLLLPPIYLIGLLLYANYVKIKYARYLPQYNYYKPALFLKVFGSIAFSLVYIYHYGGGDTTNYYQTALTIQNLFFDDLDRFNEFFFSNHEIDLKEYYFSPQTGYPIYRVNDNAAMFTAKFYAPVMSLAGNSFFAGAILAATISFTGLWRLYNVFITEFPALKRELFIAIFGIPSVFFWGSGIMKDSITIAAVGWYVYAFYWFFIRRRRKVRLLVYIFISAFLMISIKPYIFFALLPGSIIWWSNQYATRFSSKTFRRMFTPFLLAIGMVLAYYALSQLDSLLGLYKIDTVAERAQNVNSDLKMDYYGGKSFSIGDYDPTIAGMLSVSHKAIFAALFRPSILDVQNVVMLLTAVENTLILLLTVFLLIRLKFLGFFRYIFNHPLLLFSVLFALFFAFSVGVSISNFGALVRLRIPAMPFFVSALFIIRHLYEQKKVSRRLKFAVPSMQQGQ